jgi:peptidoglycan/LPS O-acetylase OafA/YrhL
MVNIPRVATGTTHARRADIQGLRAVAVVLVVTGHLSGWPAGGFIGVDVFFVLSGFLITGLLIREHADSGRISMVDFWRRRVKRLMPAAVLVLLVTAAASFGLLGAGRALGIVSDGVWSLLFMANWHFAWQQTDYFAADGAISPFQHFWSLSVEEQFYVVWPLLLIGLLFVTARGRRARVRNVVVGVASVLVAGASFAWSLSESVSAPGTAYFSTLDRAWELAVGALIAALAPQFRRLGAGFGTVLSWCGLAGIVGAALLINDDLPFPAPWAAVPVLATAAVIVGGSAQHSRPPILLTTTVSRYIGDISYSLYLWHFPVFVLAVAVVPQLTWVAYPIGIAFAVVSYHLVEHPAQTSPWLRRSAGRNDRRSAWRTWRRETGTTLRNSGLAGVALVTTVGVGVVAVQYQPIAIPRAAATAADAEAAALLDGDADEAAAKSKVEYGPAVTAMQEELATALQAVNWPVLDPSLDAPVPGGTHLACSDTSAPKPLASCTFGPTTASKTVMLVGDSTAAHELDAFVKLAQDPANDIRVLSRAGFACSFVDLRIETDRVDECQSYREETLRLIEQHKPDLLVITNSYAPLTVTTGRAPTIGEWSAGLRAYAERVEPLVGEVMHLTPPPAGANVESCYRPTGSPSACLTTRGGEWKKHLRQVETIAHDLDQRVVDISPLVCVDDACPAFAGTTPIKIDSVHFSGAFALKMAPGLKELLDSAAVPN